MGGVGGEVEVGSSRGLDPDRRHEDGPFAPSAEHGAERRRVFAVKLWFTVVVEGGGSGGTEFVRGITDTRSHIRKKVM